MNVFSLWLTHAVALTLKETRQILRDKSAILLGVFMPLMLIILFGYGLSFDVRNIRLGVVDTVRTEQTERITEPRCQRIVQDNRLRCSKRCSKGFGKFRD